MFSLYVSVRKQVLQRKLLTLRSCQRGVSTTAPVFGRKDGNTIRASRKSRKTVARQRQKRRKHKQGKVTVIKRSQQFQKTSEYRNGTTISLMGNTDHTDKNPINGQITNTGELTPSLAIHSVQSLPHSTNSSHVSQSPKSEMKSTPKTHLLSLDTNKRLLEMHSELNSISPSGDGSPLYSSPKLASTRAYNELIRAQALQGQHSAAFRSYQRMEILGLKRNLHTFQAILYNCALSKDVGTAKLIMQQLANASFPMDSSLYAHLAQAFVSAGQLDDAFGVLELANRHALRQLKNEECNAIGIKNTGKILRHLANPDLETSPAQLDPDVFTVLIKGCVDVGDYRRAWNTFDQMRIKYAAPDEVCLNLMIHICAKTHEPERAIDMWNEFESLDIKPSQISYNSIINACAKSWHHASKAFDYYFQMRSAGFVPDSSTFNSLIASCSHSGDLLRSTQIFDMMKLALKSQSSVLHPTKNTYATYLNVIARAQKVRNPSPTLNSRYKESHVLPTQVAEVSSDSPILDENGSTRQYNQYDDIDFYEEQRAHRHFLERSFVPSKLDDMNQDSDSIHDMTMVERTDSLSDVLEVVRARLDHKRRDNDQDNYNDMTTILEELGRNCVDSNDEKVLTYGNFRESSLVSSRQVGGSKPYDLFSDSNSVKTRQSTLHNYSDTPMTIDIPAIGRATIINMNIQLAWKTFQSFLNAGFTPNSVSISFIDTIF